MADEFEYVLDKSDLEKCVKFAVDMHLKTGGSVSRTTGQARGLGTMINDWLGGKAVELGAKKILEKFDSSKELILDFSIHEWSKRENDPDIVKVKENGQERTPRIHVEVKNFGENDRWIGLSKIQFDSISGKVGNDLKNAYLVYAYVESNAGDENKVLDLLGTFLQTATKAEYSSWFDRFVKLGGIKVKVALIMTLEELMKYGTQFNKDRDLVYETDIFEESARNVMTMSPVQLDGNKIPLLRYNNCDYPSIIGPLVVRGKAKMYMKQNPKNKAYFLECVDDVSFENEILGVYHLSKGKVYKFNFGPAGRNPAVFGDSIWIATRKALALFSNNVEPVARELTRAI